MQTETTEAPGNRGSTQGVSFAHESEREFAAILDYYQIRWAYEPRTFPVRWDADGRATESFTPDFYLIDQDLFVELTTLKQKLVTRKNRKLRLLRARYPEVKIKLFYGRDMKSLMTKYGLREIPRGESGQADAPPRQMGDVPRPTSAALRGASGRGEGHDE
ncbi:MAG: hypothetical protein ACREOS_11690 [Candidatus Dormibacteraceae bacterium]